MARAVEQIEREIVALDQAVVAMAETYQQTYQNYLAALGTAIRQQLILAAYHLCTHGYPEAFLQLSLAQRQELQQALKQIGKQAQSQLRQPLPAIQPIEPSEADLEKADLEKEVAAALAEELLEQATLEFEASEEETDGHSEAEQLAAELISMQSADYPSSLKPFNLSNPAENAVLAEDTVDRALTPKDIARWQARMEKSISLLLQDLSHQANRVLQQAQILPQRLPEPVLEVATKADLASDITNSSPNLLNLLVEASGEGEKPSMTQVIAIRLRLSEIEFRDTITTAQRTKLRQLLNQLTQLGRDYQRKQKEYAVAQAEAAWRASWYDPED